jgi:hypothetical protein
VVPVLCVVAMHGKPLLEKLGFIPVDLMATFNWFTQKHGRRKWGAVVSNAMVVLAAVLTQADVREDLRASLRETYPDS